MSGESSSGEIIFPVGWIVSAPPNTTPLTVTINQATSQDDPTHTSPIQFAVTFSEPVTGFDSADVVLSGTAGASTAVVSGSGTTYTIDVSGMTSDGTVLVSIPAGVAQDAAENSNTASTSTDNAVTYDATPPTVTVTRAGAAVTNVSPIVFNVVFNEPVTGFGTEPADLDFTGSTMPATLSGTVSGSGTTYTVSVTGMASGETVALSIPAAAAQDAAGNGNAGSNVDTVMFDTSRPTVTINQAGTQADPTNNNSISFTVVFNEPVVTFGSDDITVNQGSVVEFPPNATPETTFTITVTNVSTNGPVTASVMENAAFDIAGNTSAASTSTDNSVTYDTIAPAVTITRPITQLTPTNTRPITFSVEFTEPVTGFDASDVTFDTTTGSATNMAAMVTGTGTTYTVSVTNQSNATMTDGRVKLAIGDGAAQDTAGNLSAAATSTEENTVTYDTTRPTVTINQAAGQVDPTNTRPILFTVLFSEPVTGFEASDVTFDTTAGSATNMAATVTGTGTTYTVSVTNQSNTAMTDGRVKVSIASNRVQDAAGNSNTTSTSTDSTVTYDATRPTVTINQAAAQSDPTNASPVVLTVVFSEPVTGFAANDINLLGTANPGAATVTGSGTTYTVSLSGMTGDGTVRATISGGAAQDAAGNTNTASTSTDNTVTYDATRPTVTIDQRTTQADPTTGSSIKFDVVFSEPVTGFEDSARINLSGTANPSTAVVSGSGTTYTVTVSGMTQAGTVHATLTQGAGQDAAGNASTASTSSDNTVLYCVFSVPSGDRGALIDAIDCANAMPGNNTITLAAGSMYTLIDAYSGINGLPPIDPASTAGTLTINGNGATIRRSTAAGIPEFRFFNVQSGADLTLNDLTLTNGRTGSGGAILSAGTLEINGSTLRTNTASGTFGGALYITAGTVTITTTTLDGNVAQSNGGGMWISGGNVTISRSTLVNNTATTLGGGIRITNGTLVLANSTVSASEATNGGGLSVEGGTATLTNDTFSGNSASQSGGALRVVGDGTLTLRNTILANSTSGSDCYYISSGGAVLNGAGKNLIEDGSCTPSGGSRITGDPLLDVLGDYNGPTQTHRLLANSPAIDQGTNSICTASPIDNVDQRNVTRPRDGDGNGTATCDIGSYER